jgi:hypothetical protein
MLLMPQVSGTSTSFKMKKTSFIAHGRWHNSFLGRTGVLLPAVAALLLLGGGLAAYAQTGGAYDLTWWTVDGGGKTGISGGEYTLLSTAGQPDAEVPISGGQYTLLSGFWPGEASLVPVGGGFFLPIIMRGPAPDLIGSFSLSPDKSSYSAGEAVLVTAVVTNTGTAAAGPFWVDFFINPSRTPTVNDPWNSVCGLSPCYGLAWYVPGGLGAGASVTLRSDCADSAQYPHEPCYGSLYSVWPGHFASGSSDLYLYVDSWNRTVPSGGVLESDETNNLSERHGLAVTGLGAGAAGQPFDLPAAADLPPRPARPGQ